ncbi:MAG: L-serine ammonia-lyase [Kiritimatiellaeota bacterium]|nr:L-serine ammonia-lyase [Kiritimatiellota bacterium]
MMPKPITLSIFDIFKIGPGPSSSHTIGPMLAAADFVDRLGKFGLKGGVAPDALEVSLYGSLASTGKGHGTHRAILGGLLGWRPETCDCDALLVLFPSDSESYEISVAGSIVDFSVRNIHFVSGDADAPYQNTLDFKLFAKGELLVSERYFSIGGGFIKRDGDSDPSPIDVPYKYSNMREFRKITRKTGLSLSEIMMENELAVSGMSVSEVENGLDDLLAAMTNSVDNGLKADGLLPGPIGLLRKARYLFESAGNCEHAAERALARLNAYALAASEENAAGRRIVTAPTSGASGVLPGLAYMFRSEFGVPDGRARSGLLAAALIGFVAKSNASIAGAEVGCQGEVGVASSMAAAFAATANGCDVRCLENAAEIALEHHLGLTCDPIDGYVQVPCIERNAVGAVTAFNAYILASAGDPVRQKITFDEVLEAMLETGVDMSRNYKETARGGLAVCCVCC